MLKIVLIIMVVIFAAGTVSGLFIRDGLKEWE